MSTRRVAVGAGVVAGGALVVAIAGSVLSAAGAEAGPTTAVVRGTAQTAKGVLPHAFLTLEAYPDSLGGPHGKSGGAHPDWVTYGPTSNLHVPAHALVTVTIKQYDSGGPITNPYFAHVHGTVGGTAVVDGKTVKDVDPNQIGHTFTIHSLPTNQDPLFVSVPLPATVDDAPPAPHSAYTQPHVVTFSFVTGGRGHYVWNCEYPCGDDYYANFGGPMSTRGYMSGTLTVE